MLQNLTRSTIVVPACVASPTTAPAIAPLPLLPGEADLNACSLDHLAKLADLSYRAGDRASAEYFIRCLYARHDRQAEAQSAARSSSGAAPRRQRARAASVS
jgi:hypothetical protein